MRAINLFLLFWHFLSIQASEVSPLAAQTATEQLIQAAHESPDFVVPITGSDLSLISLAQREHFTLILLTSTDEKHACESCHRIRKVLSKVVYAWIADYLYLDYLFFAEIDLVDPSNADIFNHLRLQSVPQLWVVPPLSVASKHKLSRQKKYDEHGFEYFDNYDILLEPHADFRLQEGKFDDQVFQMADWLAKTVQKQITIRQEDAYAKFAGTFIATLVLILTIKKRGPSFVTRSVTKSKILVVIFFAGLLILLGGFLFSTMQKVPFIAQNDKGEPIYISGGTLYQFGNEMILVGLVYGLLGANIVALTYLGNYKVSTESVVTSELQRGGLVLLGTASLYLLYSVMTSMYLRKDHDFPYHLAKLF